jgi:hypothetical protein
MVSLTALWLPIVLSAVLVYIVSFIIHMVLRYHRNDYKRLPNEEDVLEAIRKAGIGPGSYYFPGCEGAKEMGSPEMKEKYNKGPVGMLTLLPNAPPMMAKHLVWWFILCLIVGIFAAYVAGRALSAGAEYLLVFRVVGSVAFIGYAAGQVSDTIWKGQSWGVTFKHVFDGLIYALLTAGVFAWLWPE